jgi:hypothetical protein
MIHVSQPIAEGEAQLWRWGGQGPTWQVYIIHLKLWIKSSRTFEPLRELREAWEAMTVGINTMVSAGTGSGRRAGSLMSGSLHTQSAHHYPLPFSRTAPGESASSYYTHDGSLWRVQWGKITFGDVVSNLSFAHLLFHVASAFGIRPRRILTVFQHFGKHSNCHLQSLSYMEVFRQLLYRVSGSRVSTA